MPQQHQREQANAADARRGSAKRLTSLETDWRDPQFLSKRRLFADVCRASLYVRGWLLDVGCGQRPYEALLWDRCQEYVGVDADRLGSRPRVAARATALPFAPASFDTVLATQMLEHVKEPPVVLGEIARVLRPKGHLILTAPQSWRLHEEPNDYYRFTRYGLEHLAKAASLEPIELRAQGGAWSVVGQVTCNALERRRRLRRLIPLVNLVFRLLDDRWPDEAETLNYLLVARKPGS